MCTIYELTVYYRLRNWQTHSDNGGIRVSFGVDVFLPIVLLIFPRVYLLCGHYGNGWYGF